MASGMEKEDETFDGDSNGQYVQPDARESTGAKDWLGLPTGSQQAGSRGGKLTLLAFLDEARLALMRETVVHRDIKCGRGSGSVMRG